MSQCYLGIEIMWEMSPPHLHSPHPRRVPLLVGAWSGYVSVYIGSFDPIAQFNCVPVLRNQFVVATAAYFCERYVALTVVARQIENPNVGFRLM